MDDLSIKKLIKDQKKYLQEFRSEMSNTAEFISIEYKDAQANQWVPYPISFDILKTMIPAGYEVFTKVAKVASKYHGGIYSAYIRY